MFPPEGGEVLLKQTGTKTVVWQGSTWESYGVGLSEYKKESSGESSRPKFTLFNPDGLFSNYVHRGWMDGAEIIRYRVLKQHLDSNTNSFIKNTWRVGKVLSLGGEVGKMIATDMP